MVTPARTVKITDEISVDTLLASAEHEAVVVEHDGVRYRISREEPAAAFMDGFDPERASAAIDELAEMLSEVDPDAWIASIYEARERGSRHNVQQ